MRVIFINRYFFPDFSATSLMLTDLVFHLAAAGYEVEVITSRQRYDDAGARLARQENVRGVLVRRVRTSTFGRQHLLGRALDYLGFYCGAAWALLRHARRGDVVVAKTDPPLISVVAAWACMGRGVRLLTWNQDLFPELAVELRVRGTRGLLGRVLKRLRNRVLRKAQCNVVIGERMAERLVAEGVERRRIAVVPNWADGEAVRPIDRADNPLHSAWGLNGKFVVAYSGNMGRAHEFDTLLGALGRLASPAATGNGAGDAEPEIVFLFIGGGRHLQRLQAEVRRRGWQHVRFMPYQPRDQLRYSLGVADLHLISLQPALEGLIVPSKFYGIAAAGRPSVYIGDSDGEIPRILAEAQCGFTVAPGDVDALVQCVRRCRAQPAVCTQMGRNARAVFEQRFAAPLAFAQWRRLLHDVVAPAPMGEHCDDKVL